MAWSIEYSDKARKQLKKLDPNQSKLLIAWIEKNLLGCDDPRSIGTALSGDKYEWWRYRVGSYRLLVEIKDEELVILIVQTGHRRDVYR
ncbi:type II toxin-antitoxin system RelE family toxin [Raoultibacter phocaeensis]|uniref:type II toxin-antitoxin system RelE family toxin n=1 Tax=Raoultibacter phocaeensis TaxID=2479841 RepID=UPI0011189DD9|nr:type II toxin-antitoxin system RelE/ParE family toxin [Raoultibacter phocaeensis]